MTTLLQNLSWITDNEANILIDKYLDLVEDLEDYIAIKKHQNNKNQYLSEKDVEKLFSWAK